METVLTFSIVEITPGVR